MKNEANSAEMNTGFGGIGGLVDLQTTIAGFEITLETLVEISNLLKRLDERLAQLSPDLPQVGTVASGGQSLSGTFEQMLSAYQEAFAAMAAAARSAALLGLGDKPVALKLETSSAPAPKAVAPAPAAPAAHAPEPVKAPESEPVVAEAAPQPAPQAPVPTQPVATGPAEPRVPVSGRANLTPVGTDASQRLSYPVAGKQIKAEAEIVKPLKPIDMPNVEHHVGPMICHGMGVIYAHGTELKKHWPGQRDSKVTLESAVPNERWRLLAFGANVFCVREDGVTILNLGELHKEGSFQGKYVAQTHTTSSWVGVQSNNGELSVEFREKTGKAGGDAAKLGNFGPAQVFVAAAGESAYVAIESGELFRVEGSNSTSLPKANKRGSVVGLSVDDRGLILTNQGPHGVVVSLLDQEGNLLGESPVLASYVSHAPVLSGDKAYLFDDSKSEVVSISLDTLDVVDRKQIEPVKAVARLLALEEDAGVTLAILACDQEGRPTDVYLHSTATGTNTKLCHLSASKGEIGFADGHIAVSSTSSMQNMVQVFSVYGPAVGAKAAA